ncbi:MAG: asparagine synthase (glutamine-hydrolyzing) [Acidobacteria bacterium]|nr:asparagine synthase (glutamine-hydrolyzing) [Acidobacteriota bacterium]
MCGINGILYSRSSGRIADEQLIRQMRDVLRHRGPDEEGIFTSGRLGLGHRRLSIVDLKTGQQPMFNDDRSLVIVYNGEVYNHLELRPELEQRGFAFRTTSDTETILRAYEAYGPAAVERFRGMFSFAIWDTRSEELFIARDRLGVKPLYYAQSEDGSFYFGSEIKALLAANALRPELEMRALTDYLANHAPSGELTLFAGVKRLLPGHTLTVKDEKISIRQFWDVSFERNTDDPRSDADWVRDWSELFRESVRLRLMSDVPLGMFLSGGIDSSAIAAVMSELVDSPIKTFSVAFAEREANELRYARLVAERFATDHHEITVAPEEFFSALPKLIWHEDEPIAHPSSIALYFVSKLAAENVKVVLTGEGSDESLAGYGRYWMTLSNLRLGSRYHGITSRPLRAVVETAIEGLPAGSRLRHRLRKSFLCVEPTIESMYFDNFAVFSRTMQDHLLSPGTKELLNGSADPYREMSSVFASVHSNDLLDKMLYADTKTYLQELLMKQDQMSMAASIESRVPFLDHKLVEFTAAMPNRMKLRGRTTKYVLRKAMEGVLPDEILTRGKMGFPVPIGKWFRGEFRHLVDEYVLSERSLSRGLFEPTEVRQIVERHMTGENHDERLWSLINLEIWQRTMIEGESTA